MWREPGDAWQRTPPQYTIYYKLLVRDMRATDVVTLLGYSQLKLRTGRCLATVVPMVNIINNLVREMRGNGCRNPSWLLSVNFGTGRCSATVSHDIDIYMGIYIYMYV